MPVYHARKRDRGAGHAVGILLLECKTPFPPGDVGNATTYDYPALFKVVPGAHSSRVLPGDPELGQAVVAAARELEAAGVKGISSDCGFFLNYQDLVRDAVGVPVYLSSLLQLPMISALLGKDKAIGVITSDSRFLSNRMLELSGVDPERRVVMRGMHTEPEWLRAVRQQCGTIDTDLIREETVKVAKEMVAENPDVGALLLECSVLPLYAHWVQEATGLPAYDFMNMIDYFQHAGARREFAGSC